MALSAAVSAKMHRKNAQNLTIDLNEGFTADLTVEDLFDFASSVPERYEDITREVENRVDDFGRDIEDMIDDQMERFEDIVEEVSDRLQEFTEEVIPVLEGAWFGDDLMDVVGEFHESLYEPMMQRWETDKALTAELIDLIFESVTGPEGELLRDM
jgi:hypothetical protein